jgi:hypothetical protein
MRIRQESGKRAQRLQQNAYLTVVMRHRKPRFKNFLTNLGDRLALQRKMLQSAA